MSADEQLGAHVSVTSLSTARRVKRRFDAVLTIEDPGLKHGLRFHRRPRPDQLILMFEDIDTDRRPDFACASSEQVVAGIDFGRDALSSGKKLLIHCRAGVSRSTSMYLGVMSAHLGDGAEDECVRALMAGRPESVPNLHVLRLADEILGRSGRLYDAVMRFEAGNGRYAFHRDQRAETLRRSPALYAKGLPEGVSGIHLLMSETAPDASLDPLKAR
jgi:predicted protein tyrosine phosphatase